MKPKAQSKSDHAEKEKQRRNLQGVEIDRMKDYVVEHSPNDVVRDSRGRVTELVALKGVNQLLDCQDVKIATLEGEKHKLQEEIRKLRGGSCIASPMPSPPASTHASPSSAFRPHDVESGTTPSTTRRYRHGG